MKRKVLVPFSTFNIYSLKITSAIYKIIDYIHTRMEMELPTNLKKTRVEKYNNIR